MKKKKKKKKELDHQKKLKKKMTNNKIEIKETYNVRNLIEEKASYYLSAFSVLGLVGVFKILEMGEKTKNNELFILKIALSLFAVSLLLNLLSWRVSISAFDERLKILKKEIKKQKKTEWPKYMDNISFSFAVLGFVFLMISFWRT